MSVKKWRKYTEKEEEEQLKKALLLLDKNIALHIVFYYTFVSPVNIELVSTYKWYTPVFELYGYFPRLHERKIYYLFPNLDLERFCALYQYPIPINTVRVMNYEVYEDYDELTLKTFSHTIIRPMERIIEIKIALSVDTYRWFVKAFNQALPV